MTASEESLWVPRWLWKHTCHDHRRKCSLRERRGGGVKENRPGVEEMTVGEVLGTQPWGLESRSSQKPRKPWSVVNSRNLSAGGAETGGSLGSQASQIAELQF